MILVAVSFTAAQFLVLRDEFWLTIQVDPLSSLGSLAFVFVCVTVCLEIGDPQ